MKIYNIINKKEAYTADSTIKEKENENFEIFLDCWLLILCLYLNIIYIFSLHQRKCFGKC